MSEKEKDEIQEEKEPKEEEEKEEDEEKDIDEELKENLRSFLKTETKNVKDEMKKKLEKWLEEKKESKEKKSGLYQEDVRKQRNNLNDVFKKTVNAVYQNDVKTLQELKGGVSRKELTTDSTGTPYGGYAVDSELSAEIRHLATDYGVARQEMSVLQLSKNSYSANSLASDVSVFWVDEASTIGSTQLELGQSDLELKKLGAIATITSELLEDQEVDLFNFIAQRIAEGFAKAEDEAFFIGDGTSTYGSFTGIIEAGDVNSVTLDSGDTSFTNVTAEKLLDMQTETPQAAQANAKYYMHRSVFNQIRKLRADAVSENDSAGEFLYQAPGENQPTLLWGKPVVLVEAMPSISDSATDSGFVIYGDLKRGCIFGNKGAVSAKRFDAGVVTQVGDTSTDINLITSDREAIRWTERVGYIRILPTAMTVLKTNAS